MDSAVVFLVRLRAWHARFPTSVATSIVLAAFAAELSANRKALPVRPGMNAAIIRAQTDSADRVHASPKEPPVSATMNVAPALVTTTFAARLANKMGLFVKTLVIVVPALVPTAFAAR